jgi:hypothetical protein
MVIFVALRIFGNTNGLSFSLWASMIIQLGASLLLLSLCRIFTIIRQRSLLPAFFYLLLTGTDPLFFYSLTGSIAALIILCCFFFLFSSYQNPRSQINSFNIALLLTVGSFCWTPLLLFFPLFWFGMNRFRNLNLKTFFAGLIGFILVYLFIFTWSVYKGNWDFFLNNLPDFRTLLTVDSINFSLREGICMGFVALLFIISASKALLSDISEKTRTRITLNYLAAFFLVVFILLLFRSEWKSEWLLILYAPISLLIAHFFTFTNKKGFIWLFLFSIVFFLGMFAWKYLILT